MCCLCDGNDGILCSLGGGCHADTFASSSQDQHVMIWSWDPDCNEATLVSVCKGHSDSIESIAPSPDKQKVSSTSFLPSLFYAQ